jgi:gliding motility-associated-like protein
VCINQPIDSIVYVFNNGATSATIYEGEIPQGINALPDPTDNSKFILTGIPTQSGIFNYKIKTAGGCLPAEISGSIKVIDLPEVDLETEGFVCVDVNGNPTTDVEIKTNLSPSQYTFIWSDANGTISPLETGSNYIATKPGLYSVAATNKITTCIGTANTTIVPSLPPAAATAASPSYFAENQLITITVTPIGIYEYQADNGAFQDSNQFYGLPSGRHTITVRDKFSCGSTTVDVRIIDFIKYFTPNGDGYNDVWNITEISDQPNSRIYIYDRFGKLLKQISPGTNGWDGTVNATNLPADDYWFKVFYKENGEDREFKSHFSLKR